MTTIVDKPLPHSEEAKGKLQVVHRLIARLVFRPFAPAPFGSDSFPAALLAALRQERIRLSRLLVAPSEGEEPCP